jgi:hypothetical protein
LLCEVSGLESITDAVCNRPLSELLALAIYWPDDLPGKNPDDNSIKNEKGFFSAASSGSGSDRSRSGSDRSRSGSDRSRSGSDRSRSGSDRSRSGSDRSGSDRNMLMLGGLEVGNLKQTVTLLH